MKIPRLVLSLWVPLTLLASWQAGSALGWIDQVLFPSPARILQTAWLMVQQGYLPLHIRATLLRCLTGFAAGSLSGIACGVAMGTLPRFRASVEPIVTSLNSTPKLSLLPLLMLLTGVGEAPRLVLIASVCFVLMSMYTSEAVRALPEGYVQLARNYGATGTMMLRRVYVPAVLPQVFTGLRITAGRAMALTISVELVGAEQGLGSLIWMSWQTFSTERLYTGVFAAALIGYLFHDGLKMLERRAISWKTP